MGRQFILVTEVCDMLDVGEKQVKEALLRTGEYMYILENFYDSQLKNS